MGYLIASGTGADLYRLLVVSTAVFLTVSGTTGFNMVYDADIDALMMRTRNRVIPSGVLSRREALAISAPVLVAGFALSYTVSWLFLLAGLLGFLIDIVVYTLVAKRRTWLSVVMGGFAGGMPAFGGYVAGAGLDIYAVSLLLIVAMWSSPHIWYISAYYIEDYRRASVPTLPLVKGLRATSRASIAMILVIYLVVVVDHIASGYRMWVSVAVSTVLTWLIVSRMWGHDDSTPREELRKVFKFLSPYLALLFLAMYLDRLLLI